MGELADIVLPADQLEGNTHQLGQWLKQVGDAVRRDEPLLEIITDKVTVELAAPAGGVLVEILKQPGDEVLKGEVLGRIDAGAAPAPGRTAEFTAPESSRPPAVPPIRELELSPAVRRLIQEHGLDPAQLPATGRGARITVADVEAYLGGGRGPESRPPGGVRMDTEAYLGGARGPGSRDAGGVRSTMVPHSPVRKSIAEHMVRSMQTAPHVTAVFEADLSRVMQHRKDSKMGHTRVGGVTLTAYFVRASVAALQAVPQANSRWHEDALEFFEDCNIGVAVALEGGGLIVPVLQRAQDLDLLQTAERLNDLTARARGSKLAAREVQGGTFTISNHGVSGSLLAAPIVINQPQSAILGVGKLEPRARVTASGSIEARPMAYVTLTIDHRVLDGFQANAFLGKWVEAIEQWQ